MRSKLTTEDEDLILWLYANGDDYTTISMELGHSIKMIKSIVSANHNRIKKISSKLSDQEKIDMILKLYCKGYKDTDIYHMVKMSYEFVKQIIDQELAQHEESWFNNDITVYKVKAFSKTINIGDKYRIVAGRDYHSNMIPGEYDREIEVTVIKKYPHFVMTDYGDFIYVDLYQGTKLD